MPSIRRLVPVLILLSSACRRPEPAPTDAGPSPTPAAKAAALVDEALGRELIAQNCTSCHGVDMIEHQRLTPAQWAKEVKKMSGWGSMIEPESQAALADHLAAHWNLDTPAFEPPMTNSVDADAAIAPLPDGAFAGGDVKRGLGLYATKACIACHGPDARGSIGVNLVDRPILYRAPELAGIVRAGRGRMPPQPLTDGEVADLVAYLRSLPPG